MPKMRKPPVPPEAFVPIPRIQAKLGAYRKKRSEAKLGKGVGRIYNSPVRGKLLKSIYLVAQTRISEAKGIAGPAAMSGNKATGGPIGPAARNLLFCRRGHGTEPWFSERAPGKTATSMSYGSGGERNFLTSPRWLITSWS